MFSTICICFSTSISRSAACTCSVTPSRSAASCAPRRMSTKNGWFSVFSTSATVGLLGAVDVAVSRLQESESAVAIRSRETVVRIVTLCLLFQDGIKEHGHHDHRADDNLLEKRRDAEQVQAVSQHAHDKRADQRAGKCPFAAHQARAADDRGGNRAELVHHPRDRLC